MLGGIEVWNQKWFHEAENPKLGSKMIKKPEPEEAQRPRQRGSEAPKRPEEAQKPRKGPEEAQKPRKGPEEAQKARKGPKRSEEVGKR